MNALKRYFILLIIPAFAGCDDENAFDCVKTVGSITSYELKVSEISAVEVIGDIQVTIENGVEQRITLTTGENLYPKIDFEVIDGKLFVTDNNKCSWVRKYGNSKLIIKSDNIASIKNSGSRDVRSVGTYNFTGELTLTSQNTSGDYHLNVNGGQLNISSNKVSNFYITGNLNQLNVGFYSGQGRFEGKNLTVNSVNVFHRGSNDIIVNPVHSLSGSIESYGNIVVYGMPDAVEIEQNGVGQVIYK